MNPRVVLARHQVYLERLKSGYVKDYGEAIEGLDKAMADVIRALGDGRLNQLSKKALRQLLADLAAVQHKYYGRATKGLWKSLEELSGHEALFEVEVLTAVAAKTVKIKKPKLSTAYARALASPIQATGELLEPFVNDLTARQIARVNREIRISVGQGRTISQTVQAINGTKARNYRDGVMKKNWDDARTVVRTATQQVSSESRAATWEANSDISDEYQIVATLDGKTSSTCRSLDGQKFKLNQGPMPPLHPNCRTTTVLYFKPSIWDEGATRSAEFGPVDAKTTYYEWLKDQPAAFQNDAIGPVRGKLLRDGGLSSEEFSSLQLDRNFQPLTLDEMRKLNPHAFEQANI